MLATILVDPEARCRALSEIADDCLTKPWSIPELAARLIALARRCGEQARRAAGVLSHGPLVLDLLRRRVEARGVSIHLQPRQLELLAHLLGHPGRSFTERELIEAVWHSHHHERSSIVRVQVSLLRKALGAEAGLIETASNGNGWGVGLRPCQAT